MPSRYHCVAIHLRPSRIGQPVCSVSPLSIRREFLSLYPKKSICRAFGTTLRPLRVKIVYPPVSATSQYESEVAIRRPLEYGPP